MGSVAKGIASPLATQSHTPQSVLLHLSDGRFNRAGLLAAPKHDQDRGFFASEGTETEE